MATQHYKKENTRSQIFGPGGQIKFEVLPGETGVIAVDSEANKPLFDALEGFADKRIGGVVRISPEQYESLKKNETSNPLKRASLQILRDQSSLRIADLPQGPRPAAQSAVAESANNAANGTATVTTSLKDLRGKVRRSTLGDIK